MLDLILTVVLLVVACLGAKLIVNRRMEVVMNKAVDHAERQGVDRAFAQQAVAEKGVLFDLRDGLRKHQPLWAERPVQEVYGHAIVVLHYNSVWNPLEYDVDHLLEFYARECTRSSRFPESVLA